jgi:hypothetical protein
MSGYDSSAAVRLPAPHDTAVQTALAPVSVFSRLRQFYSALFGAMTRAGFALTQPATVVRIGVFGDSVGDLKPFFINTRLQQALGNAGGFYNGVVATGGASVHSDVTDGSYWINGGWGVLAGGGALEYLQSGGRPSADTIRIYYVKESGAGTFKVQSNANGAGYADEASYTNVSAANATTAIGIITMAKTFGKYSAKLVSLTGTVRVIGVAYEDRTNGGVAVYHFDAASLDSPAVVATPAALRAGLFADLALDLGFMEFKGDSNFATNIPTFLNNYATAAPATNWVMIGTSPASDPTQEANGLVVNQTLKSWANSNNAIYFDGYSPLVSYAEVVSKGWQNDGLHLAQPAHAFLSSLLWEQMGLGNIMAVYSGRDWRGSGKVPVNQAINFEGEGVTYSRAGSVGSDTNGFDLIVKGGRAITFQDLGGNIKAMLNAGGGYSGFQVPILGLVTPFSTNGPALRPLGTSTNAGLYSSDLTPGNGSAVCPFRASEFQFSSTVKWTNGTGSPEGVVTGAVGSMFTRTDGGTGTTLYVKESGTGNTGWVAK